LTARRRAHYAGAAPHASSQEEITMLTRVDRMLLAVSDRAAAAATFQNLLGAETVRDDTSALLNARRTVVQAGISQFELLEPAGDGPVRDHLDRWGEGLFSAGFSTPDVSAMCSRLSERSILWRDEGEQVHIEASQTPGMRIVLSPDAERQRVGPLQWLYEVTNIVDDHKAAAAFYADAFGLDASRFSPLRSEDYGYKGQLTLFDPPARLDRIELSQITDPERAMGRFAAKRGQSIYMCYVETEDVPSLIQRLEQHGTQHARRKDAHNPEGLFIHPKALHGVLMGVSRTNLAWNWSGRPELAKAAP
jgi:catechol 2,3-dioxygenase-like lactoylglutathione lyase family enzyme